MTRHGHAARAARLLKNCQAGLPHPIRLIFQPADEDGGGVEAMIAGGALDGVACVFGIYVLPQHPRGLTSTRKLCRWGLRC